MKYRDVLQADRRLALLRLLAEAPGHTANSRILRDALDGCGHYVAHDVVLADLTWLSEQGLVELEPLDDVVVARITVRGGEVAAGRTTVPGVARPW